MSQLVEGFVKSGQCKNLMSIPTLTLESTIIVESLLVVVVQESGATPLTQISDGNSALPEFVMKHTTVREVIR